MEWFTRLHQGVLSLPDRLMPEEKRGKSGERLILLVPIGLFLGLVLLGLCVNPGTGKAPSEVPPAQDIPAPRSTPTPMPPVELTPSERLAIEDKSQYPTKTYTPMLASMARIYEKSEAEVAESVIAGSRASGSSCKSLLEGLVAFNK